MNAQRRLPLRLIGRDNRAVMLKGSHAERGPVLTIERRQRIEWLSPYEARDSFDRWRFKINLQELT